MSHLIKKRKILSATFAFYPYILAVGNNNQTVINIFYNYFFYLEEKVYQICDSIPFIKFIGVQVKIKLVNNSFQNFKNI